MSPEKTNQGHKILFIEDQPQRCDLIRAVFERASTGARLEFVTSPAAAFDVINRETVDAVFFNRTLSGMEGFEFLRELREKDGRDIAVIMIIAPDDEKAALQALRDGVNDCVACDTGAIETFPSVAERAIARCEAAWESSERARAGLRSQKQWMFILDAMTDYIFVIDDHHRLFKVNNALATAFGVHPREMVGKQFSDFFGTDILSESLLKEVRDDGKRRTYERALGDETYQISIFPLREDARSFTIHMMKNITELQRLKERLLHADTLVTMGSLVPGVAHEINNPLTATIAYAELLSMTSSDENARQDLNKILECAERCRRVIDNLLTFSRQRPPSRSLESINDIVDRAIDLLGYRLRSNNITVIRDYDPVSTVLVYAQQIQQAILHLLLNAEQAITGSGQPHGKITVTSRHNREDHTVTMRIVDNGPGIPPRIIMKIFDPFFTTKPAGAASGLGLFIARNIVIEHGGTMRAESPEGGGAAFSFVLPAGTGT
jgi:two-component system NtrC family sensor kinase